MASYQQVLAGTPVTITETFYLDGAPFDLVEGGGLPTLTLTRPNGTAYTPIPTVLNSWTGRTTGQYRFVLPRQPNPYRLTYALEGIIGGEPITLRGEVEWIGANLFNLDDLRGMRVSGDYPFATNAVPLTSNEQIQETRAAVLEELHDFLGYSPVPRYTTETHDGGSSSIHLYEHVEPRLLSVTVAGVAQTIGSYNLSPHGVLRPVTNYLPGAAFPYGYGNVTVEYMSGWRRPMGECRHIALIWVGKNLNPSGFTNATTISTPDGATYTYERRGGFTGVADLDRWLERRRSIVAV